MKSTTKLAIGAVALSLIASAGLAAMSQAFEREGEDHRQRIELSDEERTERKANREAAKEALENNDYEAWAAILADHPKAEEFVNETTFNALIAAHALKEAGDKEGAKALLEEAGIKRPGFHKGERGQHFAEFKAVIESGDYQAWLELHEGKDVPEDFLSEAAFNTLSEAHALKEAGDKEGAKALLEEAGIERPGHRGFGRK